MSILLNHSFRISMPYWQLLLMHKLILPSLYKQNLWHELYLIPPSRASLRSCYYLFYPYVAIFIKPKYLLRILVLFTVGGIRLKNTFNVSAKR